MPSVSVAPISGYSRSHCLYFTADPSASGQTTANNNATPTPTHTSENRRKATSHAGPACPLPFPNLES
jgi:hypothetical protein